MKKAVETPVCRVSDGGQFASLVTYTYASDPRCQNKKRTKSVKQNLKGNGQ